MARTTTNSSRRGEKSLSERLRFLHHQYKNERVIWDIGCDHGLLGLSFQHHTDIHEIHFVDPALAVIDVLKITLKDSYISKASYFIHHQKGQEIILNSSSNCIFIAGMGGKEIGEITLHLISQMREGDRLVVSPHRKILELRMTLRELPLRLESESVLLEDQQFYQVLNLVKGSQGPKVSLYGEDIWKGEWGKQYLDHQVKFFSLHQDEASRAYLSYLKGL